MSISSTPRCPMCGTPLVIGEGGYLVCPKCGFVLDDKDNITDWPEWRYIDSTGSVKGLERTSATNNMLRHDLGIGDVTFIRPRSRSVLKRVNDLRQRISRAHPLLNGESSAVSLFKLANEAADHFELPNAARQTLGTILRAYVERSKRSVGRDKKQIVAAALEKVIELYNLGVSKGELVDFFEINDDDLWEGLRRLNESGALEGLRAVTLGSSGDAYAKLLERSMTYVNKIVSELSLPQQVANDSLTFIRTSLRSGNKVPYGKRPEAIAAAAVYLVARLHGYDISQASVAKVVNLKESTVRKLYRFLMSDMTVVVDV